MAKTQAQIVAELRLKTDKLESDLKKTQGKLDRFNKGVKKGNTSLTKSLKAGWGAVGIAIGSAALVLKTVKSTIDATQTSGDKFATTVSGMRAATERFREKLITLDFSNLIRDLRDAKEAGEEYARSMDDVGDALLAISIRRKRDRQKLLELRKRADDKSISDAERLAIIREGQLLIEQLINDELIGNTMALDAVRQKMKDTYHLTDRQVESLEEQITNADKLLGIEGDRIRALQEIDRLIKVAAAGTLKHAGYGSGGTPIYNTIVDQEEVTRLNKQRNELIASLSMYEQGIYSIQDAYNAIGDATTEVNGVSRQFYAQLMKDAFSSAQELRSLGLEWARLYQTVAAGAQGTGTTTPTGGKLGPIPPPDFGGGVNSGNTFYAWERRAEAMKEYYDTLNPNIEQESEAMEYIASQLDVIADKTKMFLDNINYILSSGIQDMINTVAEGLGEALVTGEWEEFFSSVLSSFGNFVTKMGALIASYGTAMEAFKNSFANPYAAIVAGIALMILGGIITGAANIGPDGYAMGGIVPGTSYSGDKVPAMVNSGEMILNSKQQANMFSMLNTGGGVGQEVVFRIGNDELVGTLQNYGKKIKTMG